MTIRIAPLAVGVAVSAIALGLSASPAYATTYSLPANNSLYVIDSQGTGIYESDALGNQTYLNTQGNESALGTYDAGALSRVDNRARLIYNLDAANGCNLDSIDLLGGAPAPRIEITSTVNINSCYGLDIDSSGNALLAGFNTDSSVPMIWQLDLSTGIASNAVQIDDVLYGFTVAPNGDWYGITLDGQLVRVDHSTGGFSMIVPTMLNDAYDCKFDTDGTLWFMNEELGMPPWDLYAWRVGDNDYSRQATPTLGGDENLSVIGAMFVGYSTVEIAAQAAAAQLPNTGTNAAAQAWIFALGLAAVAGGVIVVRARRR